MCEYMSHAHAKLDIFRNYQNRHYELCREFWADEEKIIGATFTVEMSYLIDRSKHRSSLTVNYRFRLLPFIYDASPYHNSRNKMRCNPDLYVNCSDLIHPLEHDDRITHHYMDRIYSSLLDGVTGQYLVSGKRWW